MSVIVINDGMAVLRARLERDLARFSIDRLLREIDASPYLQFWVFDGRGNTARRREAYPEYKAKRKGASESIFEGMMLVKEALKLTRGIVTEVPGFEADDVIAMLVNKYRTGSMPIVINTRDFDLRALCSGPGIVQCTVDPKEAVPDHLIPLYKLFVGDPSDNISGVKLFGQKAWDQAEIHELVAIRDAVLSDQPLPPVDSVPAGRLEWIDQNRDTMKAMHKVIGFYDVPYDLFLKHTVVGAPDEKARAEMLREMFI